MLSWCHLPNSVTFTMKKIHFQRKINFVFPITLFKETGAFVYGSMGFLDKLSNGGAIMLIQYLHPSKDEMYA